MNVSNFWADRPVCVTSGAGLVGGWLVSRLVNAGADVVCLVRDWFPQSQLLQPALPRERLDWAPLYTIDEGLGHTIRWYQELLHEGVR